MVELAWATILGGALTTSPALEKLPTVMKAGTRLAARRNWVVFESFIMYLGLGC
jgi:hypothetical protein